MRKPPFSPLFIAAFTATLDFEEEKPKAPTFQSAFHRGFHCYFVRVNYTAAFNELSVRFSSRLSLLLRACYWIRKSRRLSVRFSSRLSLLLICFCGRGLPMMLSVRFSSRLSLLLSISLLVRECVSLSVRFSSRLSLLLKTPFPNVDRIFNFQSAFHRGFHCYLN